MESLSEREMQVADLVHQGLIEKEIADELHISYETARTHTKNIRRKLNARNAADITRIFLLELRPYAVIILIMSLLAILLHTKPEILETLKTAITSIWNGYNH